MSFTETGFFYPHQPGNLLQALAGGLAVGEDGLSTDFTDAGAMWADQHQALEDYLAQQVFVRLDGTLDGAGTAAVAHGIGAPFRTVLVQAFYKGASATVAVPCPVSSVDATNVNVAAGAGAAGKACLVTLVLSIVPPGW